MTIRIRNWEHFQHYRHRNSPWIKLYRELLDDPDWHELDPADAKVLVMLWLMADKEGKLPPLRKIAFRLRANEAETGGHLKRLSKWLIIEDSSDLLAECYHETSESLSQCYQHATREREGEREREKREKPPYSPPTGDGACERKNGKRAGAPVRFEEFWQAWPKGRKAARSKAERIWQAHHLDTLADQIIGDVQARKERNEQWQRGFIPHPTTYLNQRRWEDDWDQTVIDDVFAGAVNWS